MRAKRLIGNFLAGSLAAASLAIGAEARSTVTILVDGVEVDGVLGYRIEFNRQAITRTDSRRLDLAYSPDQRRLVITVTQKGLNRLQDWVNSATDAGTPSSKTISIVAKDEKDELLTRWDLTGVMPTTLSSAAAGTINEVDATIEFLFDRLRLVEARGK